MSSNFSNVTGFFIVIGSKDYPSLWSPSSKFGFAVEGDTSVAVFNSSMYDVNNVFKKPISALKAFSIQSVPTENFISNIVFEKPVDDFLASEVYENNNDNRWITALMILDYLFLHQDTRETLVSDFETNIGTILPLVRIPHYVVDSLSIGIQGAVDVSRVNFVKFTLNHGGINNNVEYLIYFNPDMLIANESATRKAVFLYEDLNNDDVINQHEWEKQIVEKHLAIFGDARYSHYKTFPTTYKDDDGNIMQHYFFVYSIIELQLENVKNTIREYLLTNRRGEDGALPPYTYTECVYHYPNLFSEKSTTIFPVETINPLDNVSFMSPVAFNEISNILSLNEYEIGNLNYKNSEVIFIGSEDASVSYNLPFAMVVVSNDENDSLPPVSSVYSKFVPIYNEILFDDPLTEPYMQFHKLVRLSLSVLYGIITIDNTAIVDINTTYPEINIIETLINGKKQISFMFNAVTYIIKKA